MQTRPDPEQLLKRVQDEEARFQRARLKVFFGAAPGVGKTYAMLQEAHHKKAEGIDVVVGVAETHRRAETMALLEGLEVLPRRSGMYRGVDLEEFDLDGALARRPGLILVDELAHTNTPGSRHPKRWQDVMELLDAGIDVATTVNVQHLESLREIVAQITGVVVNERIPDTVLERSDEMELVDISVEELQGRLQEGKIYVPDQARHAIQRFFRKGNLLALRELALRRTADLVDADMRRYRDAEGIEDTWAAGQRLLVGITPRLSSETLIREARRMSEALGAAWIAVFVDEGNRLSDNERERLESHLRLVERLGGEGVALPGHGTLAEDLLSLARNRNVTQILIGQSNRSAWLERLRGGLLFELSRQAGRIHVHVIPVEQRETEAAPSKPLAPWWPGFPTLGLCGLYVGLATAVGLLASSRIELTDIVMLFTIPILLGGIRHGRAAALAASVLSVLAFDFFFVPPRFTFAVGDVRHLGTFAIMLGMGLVIGNLTERLRQQAIRAQHRELRTLALYRLGESLVQAGDQTSTVASAVRAVEAQFQTQVTFYLAGETGALESVDDLSHPVVDETDRSVAQWAFDHGQVAGQGTGVLPASKALFLPLRGAKGMLGVMALKSGEGPLWQEPDQRHLLESFANQTAMALERAALSAEAQSTRLKAEREELRSTLLSSISHDLRTPLAGITGAVTTLIEDPGVLSDLERTALMGSIQDEAFRMHRLVSNLLDLTRLESGAVALHREWVPAEEVVGSALSHLGRPGEGRDIQVSLERPGLLLHCDSILLEQVVINLVENALKFSPVEQPVEVRVFATGKATTIMVCDRGPGIPEGFESKIFDKLFRLPGRTPGSGSGAGLGLAICQGIVQAHGGKIQVTNRPDGGAQFVVFIPFEGEPPAIPAEEDPGE